MRSGAGAFCPGCRRLERLLDFFTRALPAAEAFGFEALRVGLLGVEGADHTVALVRSSAKPTRIDVRTLIVTSTIHLATFNTAKGRDQAIELLLVFRWYDTGQEHRKGAVGVATAQNLEHYVGSGLQLSHGLLVVVHGGD